MLFFARVVIGLAVGSASMVAPLCMGEAAPPRIRGVLGAIFHVGDIHDLGITPDVMIACTGHGPLMSELGDVVAPDAVICLTGISSGTRTVAVGLDEVNTAMLLENTVLFGSVNARRRRYQQAADALGQGRYRLAGTHDHPAGPGGRFRRAAQETGRRQSRSA